MTKELEACIYVVIADYFIDIIDKNKLNSNYQAIGDYIQNVLERGKPDLVVDYILPLTEKVNKIYGFDFDEMVVIVGRFFIEGHYRDYIPVLQSIRSAFNNYLI